MSFKLKLKTLNNEGFIPACQELMNLDLDATVSYNLSKIVRKINQEHRDASDTYNKIVGKHCDKDKDGNWVPRYQTEGTKEKPVKIPIPRSYVIKEENKEAFQKDVDSFLDTEFTIDRNKIKVSTLEGAKVKPGVFLALDAIIEDVPNLQPVGDIVDMPKDLA